MLYPYFKRSEIEENFQQHRWESVMFKEFEVALTSKTRPFPNGDTKYIITFEHIDLS